jgi:uncharacterized delta-60 repeat protein
MTTNTSPSFSIPGVAGTLIQPVGSGNDRAASVALQADGKIVVAGSAFNGNNDDFAVLRYNSDGSLDSSFGSGGKVLMPVLTGNDAAQKVLLSSSGQIYVVGTSTNTNGSYFSAVRLNADGSLDTSYATQGKSIWHLNGTDVCTDAVLNGNELWVAGYTTDGSGIQRFGLVRSDVTSNQGHLSFQASIAWPNPPTDFATALLLQGGKPLLAGYSTTATGTDFSLLRYTAGVGQTLVLDSTFAGGGRVRYGVGSGIDQAYGMALQSDGKIVVCGRSEEGGRSSLSVIRLTANGALDTSFSGDGRLILPLGVGGEDVAYKVTVTSGNKIVLVGKSSAAGNDDMVVVRLNSNGTLDSSFSGDGIATVALGPGADAAASVVVQADGKIVLAGLTTQDGQTDVALVRLNADGSLDGTFHVTTELTLGGSVTHVEGGSAVLLDGSVSLVDAELAALAGGAGDYGGAVLTLARQGGADAQDWFAGSGALVIGDTQATLNGVVVATVARSAGQLSLAFLPGVTQQQVNAALSSLSYAYLGDAPPAEVVVAWTFNDGNAGAQGEGGAAEVAGSTRVQITAVNDAPALTGAAAQLSIPADAGERVVTAQDLLTGWTDADGDSLEVMGLWSGDALLTERADGSWTVAPLDGMAASVTLHYVVSDGTETRDVELQLGVEQGDTVRSYRSIELLPNQHGGVLLGDRDENLVGNALNNLLVGNEGHNELSGGAGADTLQGGDGDDTLDGGSGADRLEGGAGDDVYEVDNLGDLIIETGNNDWDEVRSSVDWTLTDGLEDLQLTGAAVQGRGNAADNTIQGNARSNLLEAMGGDDFLSDWGGVDTLVGGEGDDTYVVMGSGNLVIEQDGEGMDSLIALADVTLPDHVERLFVYGGSPFGEGVQGRFVRGNAQDNLVAVYEPSGDLGNHTLDGGAGADTLVGGRGHDTFIVDNLGDRVIEEWGGSYDRVQSSVDFTLDGNLEALTLTGSAQAGTGNAENNTLTGNDLGNLLDGAEGADRLLGGLGDDVYVVDQTGDVAFERAGEGYDTVRAQVSGYVLGSEVEALVLEGEATSGYGNAGHNRLTGQAERASSLMGGAGNDLLEGGGQADWLDGGRGADTMAGGAGADTYLVDQLGDAIVEAAGGGHDVVRAGLSWTLADEVEELQLTGGAALSGTGNGLDNVLIGNAGANLLDGGAGADRLVGGRGNDRYRVDDAGDLTVELAGEGSDTVVAGVDWVLADHIETLELATGSAPLAGTGNALDNRITGNAGANRLEGGLGKDTLVGGAGEDTFVFSVAPSAQAGVDWLQDYAAGQDRIELDADVFTAFSGLSEVAASMWRAGAGRVAAADADDHLLFDTATGMLRYDADGAGGQAAVVFARVAVGTVLTVGDVGIG